MNKVVLAKVKKLSERGIITSGLFTIFPILTSSKIYSKSIPFTFFCIFAKLTLKPSVMKRVFLLLCVLTLTCFSVNAQKAIYYLKSTGQDVNVRTGPGKHYRVLDCTGAYGSDGLKAQLYKGEVVGTDGIKRNGFTHVYYTGWYNQWYEGWVASQYLAPTTKCRACKGVGVFNRKCPDCNGEGYHACCNYTGKAHCKSCEGIGYK